MGMPVPFGAKLVKTLGLRGRENGSGLLVHLVLLGTHLREGLLHGSLNRRPVFLENGLRLFLLLGGEVELLKEPMVASWGRAVVVGA
jgi:hypothetical protein